MRVRGLYINLIKRLDSGNYIFKSHSLWEYLYIIDIDIGGIVNEKLLDAGYR